MKVRTLNHCTKLALLKTRRQEKGRDEHLAGFRRGCSTESSKRRSKVLQFARVPKNGESNSDGGGGEMRKGNTHTRTHTRHFFQWSVAIPESSLPPLQPCTHTAGSGVASFPTQSGG
ncbi:UNVERIFIED_CONTAM: hypothetical protein K2H54_067409 [Gekko kuhli]